ncbi:hypothetical protein BH23ACT10_BH23ACT10_12510 [soil metagenome]
MHTRAIRTVAVLFGLSLMLTACDPSEIFALLDDQLVDQEVPAADDAVDDADAPADKDAPEKKKPAAKDAPEQKKPADNDAPEKKKPADDGGSSADVSAVEKEIFDTLNATRAEAGLKALTLKADISNGARDWSCQMARSGNFNHADLGSAGVNGENIAFGYRSAASVHDGWMTSEGHRRNRMSGDWTEYGIGACNDDSGTPYYTERFR